MPPRTRTDIRAQILGIAPGDWLTRSAGRLAPGRPAGWTEVPVQVAQQMLPETARLVADLPPDGSREVVWVSGADELAVATDAVSLTCRPGLVVVAVPVACDQVRGRPTVEVPLAVGTKEQPRGLFMATLSTPVGPPAVVDPWSGALTAFAWELVLTLAREVAAAAGRDKSGRNLVPVDVGAAEDLLLIRPRARHG